MVVLTFIVLFITFASIKRYTGHGKEFSLPDFSGMTMEQAKVIAKEKNLRFEIMDSVFSRRKKRGSIIEQDPPAGFKVKKGRRVFLVTNATQPEMIRMPSVVGVDFKQAWMDLEAYGLSVNQISYSRASSHENLVVEQRYRGKTVSSGAEIEKGSGIELVLGKGYKQTYIPPISKSNLRQVKRKLLDSYLNIGSINYDRTILTYEDSTRAFVWKHRPNINRYKAIQPGTKVHLWLTLDSNKVKNALVVEEVDTLDKYLNDENIDDIDSLLQDVDSL